MGAKYSSVSISGYNATPPEDDGTVASSNQVQWSKHINKIGDPIKTGVEAINTALVAEFNRSARAISSSDTAVAGDHNRTLEIASTTSPAITVTLSDAATMAAGYVVTVTNLSPVYDATIARATSGDKIDGKASNVTLRAKHTVTFLVNAGADGYITRAATGTRGGRPSVITPIQFDALGDGSTDDTTALQAAIDYAGSLTAEFGPTVVVDLEGLTYGISASLDFVDNSKVKLQNGKLLAIGTWTDTRMIEIVSPDSTYRCHNIHLSNIVLDCNDKTSGIYLDGTLRVVLEDVEILRFLQASGYGVYAAEGTVAKNDALRYVRCNIHRGVLTEWGLAAEAPGETSVGVIQETADFIMDDCIITACGIQMLCRTFANGQLIGNHIYGSNFANATVSTCADNGSGAIRVTTAAAHGYTTGQWVYITGVTGTTEANGYWQVTVIDTTNFDLDGSTFTNAFVSGGTVYASRPVMIVESTCSGLNCTGNYFDAAVVALFSFDHIFTGNHYTSGATGLGAALILVASSADETGDGLVITSGRFKNNVIATINGSGTWNETGLQLNFAQNKLNSVSGNGDARITFPSGVNYKWIMGTYAMTNNNDLIGLSASDTEAFGDTTHFWNSIYVTRVRLATGNLMVLSGSGSPESSVTANVGSLYCRSDGGTNTTLYVKESGTGNTGWAAI